MQIIVVGPPQIKAEFEQKFTTGHKYLFLPDYSQLQNSLNGAQVIFDFFLADNPEQLNLYRNSAEVIVFCHAVNISLAQLVQQVQIEPAGTLVGFAGWPTLINRPYLEVSVLQEEDKSGLQQVCQQLGTEYLIADDRVGMVTPRVLAMIINEAFYTLQEEIATAQDIDLAMKLGTNYPYGPFEWAGKIGIKHIYKLLEALYADTRDERYKICPLLKKKYLQETR